MFDRRIPESHPTGVTAGPTTGAGFSTKLTIPSYLNLLVSGR